MSNDLEGQYENLNQPKTFDNMNVRLGFVKKVYGILCFQLLLTTLICLISMYSESFANFQAKNYGIMIAAVVFSLIIMIAIFCYQKVARTYPTNYIALTSFTICEAYMVSFICAVKKKKKRN